MKRVNLFFRSLFFTTLLFFSCVDNIHVAGNDRYNLNFNYSDSTDNFSWICYGSCLVKQEIDSTQEINGKFPLLLEAENLYDKCDKKAIWFNYIQSITLPHINQKNIQFRINTKSSNFKYAFMIVTCSDGQERVLCCDSVPIDNFYWKTNTLSFQSKGIKLININLQGIGDFDKKESKMWFDRMEITVDGKDINSFPLTDIYTPNKNFVIDNKKITSLTNDSIYIPGIKKKKLIGLGESVHGCESINKTSWEIVRTLVTNESCRLIMVEYPIDRSLIWNAYVLGETPDSTIVDIKDELDASLLSTKETSDFLIWLRQYNSKTNDKVKFFGIDEPVMLSFYAPIALYLYNYYKPDYKFECREFFLDALDALIGNYLNLEKTQKLVGNSCFKDILSPKNYEMLLYTLKQYENKINFTPKNIYRKVYIEPLMLRDYNMALNVKKVMDLYLNENEKAVLYAHHSHICKTNGGALNPRRFSMGYYLEQIYGTAYFPVGLFIGGGELFVADLDGNLFFQLSKPPVNSIEQICLRTGLDKFYAPVSALPEQLLEMRFVANIGIKNLQFIYCYPESRMDGLVFIKETTQGTIMDRKKKQEELALKRGIKHGNIFQKLRKELYSSQ